MSLIPERAVRITAGAVALEGDLWLPEGALGVVLFAHGSGSNRLSPRNRYIARILNKRRLATLLVDLLTVQEQDRDPLTMRARIDAGLLAERLVAATDWLAGERDTLSLLPAYFGAEIGAAAALVAAAVRAHRVSAVVSVSGLPDRAGPALADVRAPTLLVVGGEDPAAIALNRAALARLRCEKQLVIVPGATQLFDEPGALDEAAHLARDWFLLHLAAPDKPRAHRAASGCA